MFIIRRRSWNDWPTVLPATSTLKELGCGSGALKSLDVSMCPKLEKLNCDRNKIATLKLPTTNTLTDLDVSDNQLTALDLRGCSKISRLDCSNNKLGNVLVSASHVNFVQSG